MARKLFFMRVKAGQEEEYRERHRAVWPEVLAALREVGFRNYSIFMRGRELYGYFEADDPEEAMRRLRAQPIMHRWWAYMDPVMDSDPKEAPEAEEVFHLD